MKHRPFLGVLGGLWIGLGLGWLSLPALAERADREQPMHIESDALLYEDQQQMSTFTGRVVVTKGTIVMRGARLEVRRDADGNQYGKMFAEPGQRAFFRQKREGLDEYIEGESEVIDYDGKADVVHFIRRAEMRRLAGASLMDDVKGSLIVYHNLTEIYTVDSPGRAGDMPSAAPGGRVRTMLAPRSQSPAKAPAEPPAVTGLRPSVTLPATGSAP